MIRHAKMEDMEAILGIVSEAIVLMQNDGNEQWNSSYPVHKDFYDDILAENLFVDSQSGGIIKSVVCLNQHEPDEYAEIQWSGDEPALVIHRMAVNPLFHGRGLAKELFQFAEERAAGLNLNYIRSDTCSRNVAMNTLFTRSGYIKSGIMRLTGTSQDYYCYEKKIRRAP